MGEETNQDAKAGYYCRVRSEILPNGETNCLYGKIYGDFPAMTYYLNPTPNDRNVEFDPKRNLMKYFGRGENPLGNP
jgi:hypothetical protein